AERVAVPTHALAELPEKVTFSQAATLPVAGLTALYALAKGGPLLGRRVLVTGATGGVGDFAVQLARLAGARVTASARRQDQAPALRALGAHEVLVGDEIPSSPKHDLVVESVGGRTLGTALAAIERGGTCVTLGVSAAAEVTFDARQFFATGRVTLYGFYLFAELGPVSSQTPARGHGAEAHDMELVGHDDLQGRSAYQPTIHPQRGRFIAYVGHHGGRAPNPLTGADEDNGTSIVDVTDPARPRYLAHIPGLPGGPEQGGAQMARVCDRRDKTYLLRTRGNSVPNSGHEVWDVTDPAKPQKVSTVVSGLTSTHKNWWE